ncbi:MAG: 30S ribosomal protein S4 [Candidatus Thermoplasmatota archaeon]|jgi:small subunit ribosomal protein S4|nr:30S ribosomal protein S4 [Candidatus Thermoplasmatota archaeon]MCL5963767.1 30S ribosomal protein S4 [Candidatus Thermoplasmatota archaeon]
MGDPKFLRKKYERPANPWEGERIKRENELLAKYGLKNKKELWKEQSKMRSIRRQARDLNSRLRTKNLQAEKEARWLINKLYVMGVLANKSATMDDVLALSIEDILKRRLQTVVYTAGLANTPRQARQFISHRHVMINGRVVTIPSYRVKRDEESAISFSDKSPIKDDEHPARIKSGLLSKSKSSVSS